MPSEYIPAGVLISSYVFGALVLGHSLINDFVLLTPLHLLLTAVLLTLTHRVEPRPRYLAWTVLCFVGGFGVEYLGVSQGWLFGDYRYTDVLGPSIAGVPLIIGVNWILVVYAVCASINRYLPTLSNFAKVAVAGLALVALDFLIEPVAIDLEFWIWAKGEPPLQNFIGWFIAGILQAAAFYIIIPKTQNRLAPILLLLQVAFFLYLKFAL